jgi:glutamine synthetase
MLGDIEKANQFIGKKKARWVSVNFLDVLGATRSISLPASAFLDGQAWEGVDFDGSSLGFSRVDDSDMVVVPDPASIRLDPFSEGKTAMAMGYTQTAKGEPWGPRSGLKKMLDRFSRHSLVPYISPEMEFYVFESIEHAILENDFMGKDLDWAGKNVMHSMLGYHESEDYMLRPGKSYLASGPEDTLRDFRNKLSEILLGMGYDIRYHHHECGRKQIEIETGYYPAIESADFIVNFKYAAKSLGKSLSLLPTFMPKPVANDAGSGMHFHILLKKRDKNVLNDKGGMSRLGMSFIAGLLKHAPALCAFTNPTINSYRRLIPGFEAPVAIGWSRSNRSALIRVPSSAKGEKNNLEIRNPDPSANPYMASIAILAAGLDGIEKRYKTPKESTGNLYERGEIPQLPLTLKEALDIALEDKVISSAFDRELLDAYVKAKRTEVESYRRHVPVWDFNKYFGI